MLAADAVEAVGRGNVEEMAVLALAVRPRVRHETKLRWAPFGCRIAKQVQVAGETEVQVAAADKVAPAGSVAAVETFRCVPTPSFIKCSPKRSTAELMAVEVALAVQVG